MKTIMFKLISFFIQICVCNIVLMKFTSLIFIIFFGFINIFFHYYYNHYNKYYVHRLFHNEFIYIYKLLENEQQEKQFITMEKHSTLNLH